MQSKDLAHELEILLSRKSLIPLSKLSKKSYKYALTAIFINMLSGRQLTKGQEENYKWVYNIKRNPKAFKNQETYEYIKQTVETSLEAGGYKNPNDFETIDKIFDFFRKVVEQTKINGTYLTTVRNVEDFIDVKKVYKNTNYFNIQSHQWINIDLVTGMVITVPEFFTYSDVINNWNIFRDKYMEYQFNITSDSDTPLLDKQNKIENRRLRYEIDTLMRTLMVSSVTFVESYLYYIFFNLKHSNYELKTDTARKFLSNQKVEDDEIIKRIILKEFITEPSRELQEILQKYKDINVIRNRLIHASAFENESSTSELLPLLTITNVQLIDTLDTCKRMVEIIDDALPDELKILVWWDRITHPDFKNYKKGDITSPNSPLSQIKYLEDYKEI